MSIGSLVESLPANRLLTDGQVSHHHYLYGCHMLCNYNSSCATTWVGSGSSAALAVSAFGTSSLSAFVCCVTGDVDVDDALTFGGFGMGFLCRPSTCDKGRIRVSVFLSCSAEATNM